MSKLLCLCLLFLTVNSERSSKRNFRGQFRGEALDSLYNVYDPSYLAVVWPTVRNGVHLILSGECFQDVKVFFKDFSKGRAWAFIAADASGHYNSGAHSGRRHWLGSKQQCLDLDRNIKSHEDKDTQAKFRNEVYLNSFLRKEFTQGKDWKKTERDELMQRAIAVMSSPPHRLAYSTVRLTLNITKVSMAKCHEIVQAVCLPRSCSPEDVAAIMNFSVMITDTFKSNRTVPRTVKVTSSRRVEGTYDFAADVQALSLTSVTLLLLLLSLLATLVDCKVVKCKRHVKTKTFNVQRNYELNCERKSNLVDMETLTINNMDNASNINLVTVKKVIKHNAVPPSITLDVVSLENGTGSCKRCGKYKKQCANPKMIDKCDNLQSCPRMKYNSFASLNVKRKKSLHQYLLLCFSLSYNWKRVFNTNMANKDLSVMHGLRIVTTFWIVFIHVATVTSYLSDDGSDLTRHNNVYMILSTGSLAFDTLFFVSGLFSSYHFFYLKSQFSVEELVSFGGTCGQVLQLCCFITNRAVRLLPSYAYTIFLATVLARVTHRTSTLELPGRDYNCDATWWRNILYITNAYPTEDRCLQISWYLTSETQLHAAGALVCAIAARRRTALTLAALSVVAATAVDVRSAFVEYDKPLPDALTAYHLIMERPWARLGPYFIGVFGGWLVRRMGGKLSVTRLMAASLWFASSSALVLALAVPWLSPAWISSGLHLVWPTVLLWPALVCATDYAGFCRRLLDSGAVAALSRLCYSILLLHGLVTRTVLLSQDGALCSNTMCIWSYFAGITLLTLPASLLLSLLVEMPFCSLLRRLSDCAILKT